MCKKLVQDLIKISSSHDGSIAIRIEFSWVNFTVRSKESIAVTFKRNSIEEHFRQCPIVRRSIFFRANRYGWELDLVDRSRDRIQRCDGWIFHPFLEQITDHPAGDSETGNDDKNLKEQSELTGRDTGSPIYPCQLCQG